jgi:Cation transport protein
MKALQRSAARAARDKRVGASQDSDGQDLDIEASADDPASPTSGLRTSRSADPMGFGRSHRRRGSEGANFSPRSAPAEPNHDPLPRAQTIGFAEPMGSHVHHARTDRAGNLASGYSSMPTSAAAGGTGLRHRSTGLEFERTPTRRSTTGGSVMLRRTRTSASGIQMYRTMTSTKNTGFGGWPSPIDVIRYILEKVFHRKEMPRTSTIASTHSGGGLGGDGVRTAPYFSFDVLVSRNSKFHELTEEQRDELGGVEYRAIDLLAKLIPAYWLLVNFFFIVLVAPYANSRAYDKYNPVFESQGAFNPNRTWWVFFNTVSAYTNTGLSLVDTSMTQQQDAYLPLISIAILILLGNTAFPIALRGFIWVCSKLTPSKSRVHESLRFLLDHPRRCFVYLFPSGQTWFLLCVLALLK